MDDLLLSRVAGTTLDLVATGAGARTGFDAFADTCAGNVGSFIANAWTFDSSQTLKFSFLREISLPEIANFTIYRSSSPSPLRRQ